ncbi:MAG: hypothetical protein FJY80_10280 [Candidatus Aminicenantes bacterium]|nr:hypothetical protein [Candidatus Aminicenantes bacterium]
MPFSKSEAKSSGKSVADWEGAAAGRTMDIGRLGGLPENAAVNPPAGTSEIIAPIAKNAFFPRRRPNTGLFYHSSFTHKRIKRKIAKI